MDDTEMRMECLRIAERVAGQRASATEVIRVAEELRRFLHLEPKHPPKELPSLLPIFVKHFFQDDDGLGTGADVETADIRDDAVKQGGGISGNDYAALHQRP